MSQWMKTFLGHASAILLILGVIGYIAKPHAQGFVEDTVDGRIGDLEEQMEEVQDLLQEQQRDQAVFKNTLDSMQDTAVENNVDTKMILNAIKEMQKSMQP